MHRFSRTLTAALAALGLAAAPASANSISQAFSCGKDIGNTAYQGAKNGVKIAQLAESRPECVSKAVGQDYLLFGITAALFVLQSQLPGKIKVGSCETSLRDTLAEPFAKALGGIAPAPADELITNYLANDGAALVWDFLKETPPVAIFMEEVSCGCAFIDAGINATEVKATLEANLKTAKTCTGLVKESCKDMAIVSSAAADFCAGALDYAGDAVKDGAKAVSDGAISLGEYLSGQGNAVPLEQYYNDKFKFYLPEAARLKAADPAFNWRLYPFLNPAENVRYTGNEWTAACRKYFDNNKYSADHAHKACETLAGWMDADIERAAAPLRLRLDLKKAWPAEKGKHTIYWTTLCTTPQCALAVKEAVGDYKDNPTFGPTEYQATGMLGKMRKALDATGDVKAAIAIGASSARADLANTVAASYFPQVNVEYLCFPAGGANCKKSLNELAVACYATLRTAAAKPKASQGALTTAGAKCKDSYRQYVENGWKAYLGKSFAACFKGCPAGGAFHKACEDSVGKMVNPVLADVLGKVKAGKAPAGVSELVAKEYHRCSIEAELYVTRKKNEDAFYAKWGPQCPKSPGPKPVSQAVSPCESKLRAAYEACGDRFFESCTDAGAKVALAAASKEAGDTKAKQDDRMADALKSSGSGLTPGKVAAIAGGPVGKPSIPVGTSATATATPQPATASTQGAKPPPSFGNKPPPSGNPPPSSFGSAPPPSFGSAPPPSGGAQIAKAGSTLAAGGPLKPLIDAGCRPPPGDPASLVCPAAALDDCNKLRAQGKVKSCIPR